MRSYLPADPAYGLEAIAGVATGLKDDGARGGENIAGVTGAIIYDFLGHRLNEIYPDSVLPIISTVAPVRHRGARSSGRPRATSREIPRSQFTRTRAWVKYGMTREHCATPLRFRRPARRPGFAFTR